MIKYFLFLTLNIGISPIMFAQTQDTTLTQKHERNICYDETRSDYQKSIAYFTDIIKRDPNDPEAYYNLGMSYYKLLNFDSAIIVFDKLILMDSCYNYALFNRALCKFFLKDKDGACDDFRRALQCTYPDTTTTKEYYDKYCK